MASNIVEQPAAAVLDAAQPEGPASGDSPAELAGAEANGTSAPAQERPSKKNLYFVRVPRPHVDDAPVKDLQTKLTATLTKLKEFNSKLAAKREVVSGLRSQVAVARSLKEEAAPEWQDKVTKLQELKDIRKSYQDEIAAIKAAQSGLDVRTEEELDAKLAAMEAEIAHGQLGLREEKQMVKDISRLRSQRDRVREAESRKAELAQLEGELSKVKATIKELDTEVTALRGERTQAVGILQEIQGKLREVNDSIQELEAQRSEVEARKKDLQEQIRTVQDESSGAMQEWRENRKFSVTVRDLVEAGKLEEAKALCAEQVTNYMAKLLGDVTYRKEYTAGWAEQRKYVVSDLLPGSGTAAAADVRGARDKGGRGAKGAKGDAAAPHGEPKVEGAVKAAALIEQLMQQAQATVAAQRGTQPAPPQAESADDSADSASGDAADAGADANGGGYKAPAAAAGPRVVPGATDELLAVPKKASKPKPAVSSAAIKQAELPVLPDLEFEVPALVVEREAASSEALSEQQKKEAIREENRRKAAEAEARKKRREEAAARKKQLAEARKAEEATAPAAVAPEAAAPAPVVAAVVPAAADEVDSAGEQSAPSKAAKQQKPQQRKAKGAVVVKPGPAPLKRPAREEPAWRKALKALGLDDTSNQAVAICLVVLFLVVALWLVTGSVTTRRPRMAA